MKRLAWLGLTLALTSCGPDTTALDPLDAGTGGSGMGDGGSGGAGRGHPDGSIEVTGGTGGGGSGGSTGGTGGSTGGTGGSTGGTGGSTGGTGGTVGPDAGAPDAQPMPDAGDRCQACAGFAAEYANAIKMEMACNPGTAGQCLKQTQGSLLCGCPVWVNTTVLSDDVRSRYVAAGCQKCMPFIGCPAIACINPGMGGSCVPIAFVADPGGAARVVAPPQRGQCMGKF